MALLSDSTSADEASGQRSVVMNLTAGVGRMSSPLNSPQSVLSFQATGNLNLNSDASSYQFFSNVGSFYLTFNPIAKTSFGFKIVGTYGFQYRQETDETDKAWHPYNASGELGPYLRTEIGRKLYASLDTGIKTQTYSTDPDSGIYQRAGWVVSIRPSIQYKASSRHFNPTLALSYENNLAKGSEYKSVTYSIDLSNRMILGTGFTLGYGISLASSNYPQHSASRSDQSTEVQINWFKNLSAKWSILGDLKYAFNFSSISAIYSYRKPSVSVGLSYSF